MRNIWKPMGVLCILACLLSPSAQARAAESGSWAMDDDGKHWLYYYSPTDPAKDQWIETDGKEYYVDSKGYMKTGWVTNKDDGNKYYLGEDGAKCFNMFTPDDKYVGPEGTALTLFDNYRKEIKKQLQSVLKSKEYKNQPEGTATEFLFADLNGDEYRDLVVFSKSASGKKLLLASVWDNSEKKMALSAEGDIDTVISSRLSYHKDNQTTWLRITDNSGTADYFALEEFGPRFENVWHFTIEEDDWGDPLYYVNGAETDADEWNRAIAQAEAEAGVEITEGFQLLTEASMKEAVDRQPTETELPLWQQ